ncbi:MAG: DUF4838 domain-containing protein [Treponema sp.]|jgi:hypothetical protein|nr:DUF4838 domain-containing protein [Treponema sp.]
MFIFDVARDWVVLAPLKIPAGKKAGEEIAHYIEALRKQAGLAQKVPVQDAEGPAPADTVPVILLNVEGDEGGGFSWRAGYERLEIYGKSPRGLCNGTFDFLNALGIFWPEPHRERLPPLVRAHPYGYDLKVTRANTPSNTDKIRRRRILFSNAAMKNGEPWLIWAARNKIDGAIFPIEGEPSFLAGRSAARRRKAMLQIAEQYGLKIEIGGWDLSLLVPRRLFSSNRELFRMDSGSWKRDHHFCATNPETIRILGKEMERLLLAHPGTDVFHLWPDRDHEKTWCSCPSCRAFTPEEQNRIAVNAAADVLAELRPGAAISFFEDTGEEGDILPRANMFMPPGLPDEPGKEKEGWFIAGKG